jgi:hypothetical protein
MRRLNEGVGINGRVRLPPPLYRYRAAKKPLAFMGGAGGLKTGKEKSSLEI